MEQNTINTALENRIGGAAAPEVVRTIQQVAGGDQVKTLVREQRLGGGKLQRRVETWQDVSKAFQYNEKLRNGQLLDRFVKPTPGRKQEMFLDAVVPHLVYKVWRDQHGFDLLTANLDDPQVKQQYEKLISAPELKGIVGAPIDPRQCRVYHNRTTNVLIRK